jgi:hypothetical protein
VLFDVLYNQLITFMEKQRSSSSIVEEGQGVLPASRTGGARVELPISLVMTMKTTLSMGPSSGSSGTQRFANFLVRDKLVAPAVLLRKRASAVRLGGDQACPLHCLLQGTLQASSSSSEFLNTLQLELLSAVGNHAADLLTNLQLKRLAMLIGPLGGQGASHGSLNLRIIEALLMGFQKTAAPDQQHGNEAITKDGLIPSVLQGMFHQLLVGGCPIPNIGAESQQILFRNTSYLVEQWLRVQGTASGSDKEKTRTLWSGESLLEFNEHYCSEVTQQYDCLVRGSFLALGTQRQPWSPIQWARAIILGNTLFTITQKNILSAESQKGLAEIQRRLELLLWKVGIKGISSAGCEFLFGAEDADASGGTNRPSSASSRMFFSSSRSSSTGDKEATEEQLQLLEKESWPSLFYASSILISTLLAGSNDAVQKKEGENLQELLQQHKERVAFLQTLLKECTWLLRHSDQRRKQRKGDPSPSGSSQKGPSRAAPGGSTARGFFAPGSGYDTLLSLTGLVLQAIVAAVKQLSAYSKSLESIVGSSDTEAALVRNLAKRMQVSLIEELTPSVQIALNHVFDGAVDNATSSGNDDEVPTQDLSLPSLSIVGASFELLMHCLRHLHDFSLRHSTSLATGELLPLVSRVALLFQDSLLNRLPSIVQYCHSFGQHVFPMMGSRRDHTGNMAISNWLVLFTDIAWLYSVFGQSELVAIVAERSEAAPESDEGQTALRAFAESVDPTLSTDEIASLWVSLVAEDAVLLWDLLLQQMERTGVEGTFSLLVTQLTDSLALWMTLVDLDSPSRIQGFVSHVHRLMARTSKVFDGRSDQGSSKSQSLQDILPSLGRLARALFREQRLSIGLYVPTLVGDWIATTPDPSSSNSIAATSSAAPADLPPTILMQVIRGSLAVSNPLLTEEDMKGMVSALSNWIDPKRKISSKERTEAIRTLGAIACVSTELNNYCGLTPSWWRTEGIPKLLELVSGDAPQAQMVRVQILTAVLPYLPWTELDLGTLRRALNAIGRSSSLPGSAMATSAMYATTELLRQLLAQLRGRSSKLRATALLITNSITESFLSTLFPHLKVALQRSTDTLHWVGDRGTGGTNEEVVTLNPKDLLLHFLQNLVDLSLEIESTRSFDKGGTGQPFSPSLLLKFGMTLLPEGVGQNLLVGLKEWLQQSGVEGADVELIHSMITERSSLGNGNGNGKGVDGSTGSGDLEWERARRWTLGLQWMDALLLAHQSQADPRGMNPAVPTLRKQWFKRLSQFFSNFLSKKAEGSDNLLTSATLKYNLQLVSFHKVEAQGESLLPPLVEPKHLWSHLTQTNQLQTLQGSFVRDTVVRTVLISGDEATLQRWLVGAGEILSSTASNEGPVKESFEGLVAAVLFAIPIRARSSNSVSFKPLLSSPWLTAALILRQLLLVVDEKKKSSAQPSPNDAFFREVLQFADTQNAQASTWLRNVLLQLLVLITPSSQRPSTHKQVFANSLLWSSTEVSVSGQASNRHQRLIAGMLLNADPGSSSSVGPITPSARATFLAFLEDAHRRSTAQLDDASADETIVGDIDVNIDTYQRESIFTISYVIQSLKRSRLLSADLG